MSGRDNTERGYYREKGALLFIVPRGPESHNLPCLYCHNDGCKSAGLSMEALACYDQKIHKMSVDTS